MAKKKPDNTVMFHQLKAVSAQMTKDKAASEEAQRQAKVRMDEAASEKRAKADGAVNDDERFLRAVTGMTTRDKVKKFEDAPPSVKGPRPPAPKEEDVFMQAMMGIEPLPKDKK